MFLSRLSNEHIGCNVGVAALSLLAILGAFLPPEINQTASRILIVIPFVPLLFAILSLTGKSTKQWAIYIVTGVVGFAVSIYFIPFATLTPTPLHGWKWAFCVGAYLNMTLCGAGYYFLLRIEKRTEEISKEIERIRNSPKRWMKREITGGKDET